MLWGCKLLLTESFCKLGGNLGLIFQIMGYHRKSHQTANLWCLTIFCVGVLHFLSHKHWEVVRSKEEQAGACWYPYYFISLFVLHWSVCFFTEDPVSPQVLLKGKISTSSPTWKAEIKDWQHPGCINMPWKCRLVPSVQRAGSRIYFSCGLPSLELRWCHINGNSHSRCSVDLLSLVWSLWDLGDQEQVGPGGEWSGHPWEKGC